MVDDIALQGATVRNLDVGSRAEDSSASFSRQEIRHPVLGGLGEVTSTRENLVEREYTQRLRSLGSRILAWGSSGQSSPGGGTGAEGAARGSTRTLHLNSSGSVPAP